MNERKVKTAARYLRVSSAEQAKRKSYQSQNRNTDKFIAGRDDLQPGLAYSDKGISGRTVDKRTDFQLCMADAANGKFQVLVVDSLSRFGRNAREILNNLEYLQQYGVEFISVKENFDLSSPYGKAMLTILSALAELESDMIGQRSTDGKLIKAKRAALGDCKVPAAPIRQPFGREHVRDEKYGKWIWKLDKPKAKLLRWAADEILNGRGTVEVSNILMKSHGLSLNHNHLRKTLKERCGDEWTFMGVKFKIPRILDESTIAALNERFKRNQQFNRTDVKKNKPLLNEFTRCTRCGRAIQGCIDKKTYKGCTTEYLRYRHATGSYIDCDCRFHFNRPEVEEMVFNSLYEHSYDRAGFLKDFEDQMPDKKGVEALKKSIALNEKELKKVDSKISRAVDAYLDGKMNKEIYSKKEAELTDIKAGIDADLEKQKAKLNTLPNIEEMKSEAKKVRSQLLKYYKSPKRLNDMSYDEKWALLNYFFSGSDEKGKRFGIYVDKDDQGELTFFIYGAYMLYEPKQCKKGWWVGNSFRTLKYLDGADVPHDGPFIKRRIFDNKTLLLNGG
jgi:DNA invertase Pin-like site-specific DNA recombinase